jgi:Rab3 GTPase-activating protein catalytic subunit
MELDVQDSAFEIQDFTVASPWEKLIVALEAIFRKWAQLPRDAPHDTLLEMTDYQRKTLYVRYHKNEPSSLLELLDSSNDFAWQAHPLSRWFGFSSFVTVESDAVSTDLDECRLVLSSLAIALDNVGTLAVPVFASYGRDRPRDYLGYMIGSEAVAQFTAKAVPTRVQPTLQWLVSDFARRARCDAQSAGSMSVAVHCTWKTSTNPHGGWLEPVAIPPGSYHQETPWGPDLDPVVTLAFSTTCQLVVEHLRAADAHAGEDPADCERWSLLCQTDPSPAAPLTESVRMLLQAMSEAEGFKSMKEALHNDHRLGRALLDPMLVPTQDELSRMIAELFSKTHPAAAFVGRDVELLLEVKSAPPLSLLASLCMYMLNLEGLAGVALVWAEFVRELRFLWDHFEELPRTGLPGAEPHRFCKTFQRLQMLNWCICQRRERNETAKRAALGGWANSNFSSVSDDDDDEDEEKERKSVEKEEEGGREGVKRVLDLHLLERPGVRLREPETQDQSAVTTEDIIEEQQQLMMSLGDDKRGSEMRSEMQSRSLLSDMEAFRAANGACVLEDFVRWHSPRDWLVEEAVAGDEAFGRQADGSWVFEGSEEKKRMRGRLSSRMADESNLWQRLWSEAKPVPVARQKPLIDHVREGERILNLFEHTSPFQLLQESILVSLTSAWHMFGAYPAAQVPVVRRQIASLAAALIDVGGTRGYVGEFGPEDLAASVAELEKLECVTACATSLLCKLGGATELTNALLREGTGGVPVSLEEEADRAVVLRYLQRAFEDEHEYAQAGGGSGLPPPQEREYLMRLSSRGSLLGSRLYASIDQSVTRLATSECVKK